MWWVMALPNGKVILFFPIGSVPVEMWHLSGGDHALRGIREHRGYLPTKQEGKASRSSIRRRYLGHGSSPETGHRLRGLDFLTADKGNDI